MCTYNGARHLEPQLQSIAAQTLPPAELIVCDDGSSDQTLSILEAFANTASFPVKIHRNPINLGYTGNFEKAITLCSGKFIALCDQDDLWHPEKLAKQIAIFDADSSCGGVFTNGNLIYPGNVHSNRTLWQSIRFGLKEQQDFADGPNGSVARSLLRGNVVTGMTLMFRASLRDRLLPIPKNWIHDAWLAWMICLHSKLAACPDRLVSYRVHESQQVGVPLSPSRKYQWVHRNGLGAYFSRARKTSRADYQAIAAQYQELLNYLRALKTPLPADLIAQVEKKMHYARTAATALVSARPRRVRPILGNLRSYLNYTRVPFRAIVRDLIL